jgi:glycosyltransferase A (GT-A) superfamily protein (DUF2064 family)
VTGGRRLALFVREPVPGAVKTRLEPALGAGGAARLYRGFLEDLAGKLAPGDSWEAVAVHDGPVPGPILRELFGGGWAFLPQGLGSLGARLARCFAMLAGEGEGATVVAGSDVPSLSRRAAGAAFGAMEAFPGVAFAPSPDGGFSLIGVPWGVPSGFLEEGIAWSTPSALLDAAGAARAAGYTVKYLSELADIDVPADLVALRRFLRDEPDEAPATARAFAAVAGPGEAGRAR